MWISDSWQDFAVLDCSRGEKLERWGKYTLVRPDPQAIWDTPRTDPRWRTADGRYSRSHTGGGSWDKRTLPPSWDIRYRDLTFRVKPMNFKHTGIFPEQAANWDYAMAKIRAAGRPVSVLNLFGYTGAATVACVPAGTYTLGTLFSNAGYVTGAFGKWGLGYPGSESVPSKVGFDRFYGYNCQRMAHTYYPDHLWDDDRRVDFPENVDPGRQTYSQDIIHAKALDFIHENAEAGRPFFAYLAYTLPHAELCLPHDEVYQHYVEKFKDAPADAKSWMTNGDYGTSEHPMASFAAMVSRLDRYVGEVMALLEKEGIADNTLIVFTSDNGPHREGGANPDFFHSYGPLRGCKRDMYEGGIRVPFIVSYPGHIAEGAKSDQIMAFWDIMPTFAELIGSRDTITTDGISMLPAWTGGKQDQHPYLYWEFHELGGRQAVRMGDWKGIRLNVGNDRTSFELYNLADDIHEERNVAAENPDITARINEIMDTARTPSELFNFGRAVQK